MTPIRACLVATGALGAVTWFGASESVLAQVTVDGVQSPVIIDGQHIGDRSLGELVSLSDAVSITVLGGIIVSITMFAAKMQKTVAVCNVTWDARYDNFTLQLSNLQKQSREELRHAVDHWDLKIGQVVDEINRIRQSREKHESMVYQHELKLAVMREELDYIKAHLRVPPAPLTLT